MNSIVFVMVVMTANGFWTPTLEFNTRDQCIVAGDKIKNHIEKFISVSSRNFAYMCVQINK